MCAGVLIAESIWEKHNENQRYNNDRLVGIQRLFQDGMTRLLSNRFNIIENTESLLDALAFMQANDIEVDLIIANPATPKAVELQAISEISNQFPKTKVVILTSQIDHAMLEIVVQNGAAGVLSDDISTTALLHSIEIVLLGERVAPMILSSSGQAPSPFRPSETSRASKHTALSAREEQILHCLVEGLPNKSIARNLDISEPTVKVHLKMLLRKLQLQNRTQAAIWALNNGFSQNDEAPARVPHLAAVLIDGPITAQFESLGLSSLR